MSVETMNAFECCSSQSAENAATRFVTGPKTAFVQAYGWLHRYQSRRALKRLDDRLLQDIGLTREQVAQEIEKPFWVK